VHLDSAIADIAADIRRSYNIKTPDSIIVATTLFTGSKLITRNVGDFAPISGLEIVPL
jgi:predicted nucleic acid-binding protein